MIKNGIFNLIGQSLKLGSNILVMPILIQYLGVTLFGFLSWTTAILASVQIAEGGLSAGLLFFLSEEESSEKLDHTKKNEVLSSGIFFLVLSSILVFLIIYLLSPFFISTLHIGPERSNEVMRALLIGAGLVSVRILQSFFWAVLQSKQLYKTYNTISTLQIIATNISWALLAYLGEKSLPTYITWGFIISVVFTIVLIPFAIKVIPLFNWRFSKKTTSKMLNYNLGVWGSNVGSILFSQGDKIIVGHTLGITALTTYTIFTNVVSQLNQFTAQAVNPIIPLVRSGLSSSNNKANNLSISVKNFFLLNIYLSLGGAGLFIVMAEPILQFFLKSNFEKSSAFQFQILSLIYGIYTLSVTGYYISLSLGYSRRVMIISILSSFTTLVSMYFSSIAFGIIGIVLSNAFFFSILILLVQGMKRIGLPLWSWVSMIVVPLSVVIFLSLFVSLVDLNVFNQIALSIVFTIFMTISFFNKYQGTFDVKSKLLSKLFNMKNRYE
ncbi:oligosaccharide flippase family protein [Dyadobacter sp. LHD-138]|uniref:oligosaccharide flippase family protein n=1 Tax=Dyadobacter sp. LHD-138 TaxID=3071413 RepID=UPI0027E0729C|nr:oligosaccharide flippase family protein [Dyadobacter sp. LHD-138]MDQ6481882.1 oligosaccharide flippase family protein [Dyadobacter sp. LHD-138]